MGSDITLEFGKGIGSGFRQMTAPSERFRIENLWDARVFPQSVSGVADFLTSMG